MGINGASPLRASKAKSKYPVADLFRKVMQLSGEADIMREGVACGAELVQTGPGGVLSKASPAQALVKADQMDLEAAKAFGSLVAVVVASVLDEIDKGKIQIDHDANGTPYFKNVEPIEKGAS